MMRTKCHHLWRLSQGLLGTSPLPNVCAATATSLDVQLLRNQHSRCFANDADDEAREITNPKVVELAGQIMQLNLLEVSDLTEILRKRLNIQAQPFGMPMGMAANAVAAPSGDASQSSTASPPAAEEKTEFSLRLEGFDAASKIKVIKEVRAITDLGLKEAKDLVEGAPAVLKAGLSKQDAEQLKAKLEAAGAKVQLD